MTAQALTDVVRDLDFESVPDAMVTVEVPDGPGHPVDPADVRFALEAGLFDLIAEAAAGPSPEDAIPRIEAALRRVQSLAVTTRFALFERLDAAEQQERGARMNGLDNSMTRNWMLPRLRRDTEWYAERIEALQRAIEDVPG